MVWRQNFRSTASAEKQTNLLRFWGLEYDINCSDIMVDRPTNQPAVWTTFYQLEFFKTIQMDFHPFMSLFLPHFFFFSFIQSLSLVSFDKGTSSHKCTRTFSTIQKDRKRNFPMSLSVRPSVGLSVTFSCQELPCLYRSTC